MSSANLEPIHHGYSTIRVVLDELRGKSMVVGVAAWDADAGWFRIRAAHDREHVAGLGADTRSLMALAVRQLRTWAERGAVPYAGAVSPSTSGFWTAVSSVMTTTVRLDAPRSMDRMTDPDQQVELLFEALIQPVLSAKVRQKRIDGAITMALGSMVGWLQRSPGLPAFGGSQEVVLRGVVRATGSVVIEGVNLAASSARKDADALVSKLLRIRAVEQAPVHVIVGYVTSPGGLNGETDMRDWIKEKVTQNVFDLVADELAFKQATRMQLVDVGVTVDEN